VENDGFKKEGEKKPNIRLGLLPNIFGKNCREKGWGGVGVLWVLVMGGWFVLGGVLWGVCWLLGVWWWGFLVLWVWGGPAKKGRFSGQKNDFISEGWGGGKSEHG